MRSKLIKREDGDALAALQLLVSTKTPGDLTKTTKHEEQIAQYQENISACKRLMEINERFAFLFGIASGAAVIATGLSRHFPDNNGLTSIRLTCSGFLIVGFLTTIARDEKLKKEKMG